MNTPTSLLLLWQFSLYSLMAVGGANALLPEMHRDMVMLQHWLSDAEFNSLFAIAQAAPGPNVLIVTLIGWKLAGIKGALACTLGMCAPSSLLAWQVGKLWQRFRSTRWRYGLEYALAPITVGLVLGSATRLAQISASGDAVLLLISASCALAAYASRRNPLWWLLLAAGCGGAMHGLNA